MSPKQAGRFYQVVVLVSMVVMSLFGDACRATAATDITCPSSPADGLQSQWIHDEVELAGPTCTPFYEGAGSANLSDHLVLDCVPGFASEHDRVLIYDSEGMTAAESDWMQLVDFIDEVWIFDVGALGRASIVVSFHYDSGELVADLYDDKDRDGEVRYRIENGYPRVTESPYWTVRVLAPDGWWLQDGRINYNLQVLVDGPVLVTFGSQVLLDRLSTDGRVDYRLYVRDQDEDGRPDHELRNAFPPVPDDWGVYRSILIASSREGDDPIQDFIFWPYLGSSSPLPGYDAGTLPGTILYDTPRRFYGIVKDYGESFPPIQVDWGNARINYVGEFVASHGTEKNWYIESIVPIKLDQLNQPDFENPVAYYDLAADGDGIPELQIRSQYWGPNDPFYPQGGPDTAYQNIRYSWDQDNDQTWDYKIDLVGRHPEDFVVQFPEFSVLTVPYDRLPTWVTDKTWDVAAFVSWEAGEAWTSEGIYEWGASREMERSYIAGLSSTRPISDYVTIDEGFRGEYRFEYGEKPVLYFSPVDRKLHLLGAEAGVWQVDQTSQVKYENLNADPYIDQWQYLSNDYVRLQLNLHESLLAYTGENSVQLKWAEIAPSLFEVKPPGVHREWVILAHLLESNSRDFAPDDFDGMLSQFEGSEWRVDAAEMRGFRAEGDAFRFVLELKPGFSVTGSDGPDLDGLHPGEYVVSHTGRFEVLPLTPARVEVVPGTFHLSDASPVAHESLWIEAKVRNVGLEDAPDVWIRAYAGGPDGNTDLVAEQEIELLAGGSAALRFDWAPPGPGPWRITLDWDQGSHDRHSLDASGSGATLDVQVERSQPLNTARVWQLSNQREPLLLLGLLFAVALAAASALVLGLRAAGGR